MIICFIECSFKKSVVKSTQIVNSTLRIMISYPLTVIVLWGPYMLTEFDKDKPASVLEPFTILKIFHGAAMSLIFFSTSAEARMRWIRLLSCGRVHLTSARDGDGNDNEEDEYLDQVSTFNCDPMGASPTANGTVDSKNEPPCGSPLHTSKFAVQTEGRPSTRFQDMESFGIPGWNSLALGRGGRVGRGVGGGGGDDMRASQTLRDSLPWMLPPALILTSVSKQNSALDPVREADGSGAAAEAEEAHVDVEGGVKMSARAANNEVRGVGKGVVMTEKGNVDAASEAVICGEQESSSPASPSPLTKSI